MANTTKYVVQDGAGSTLYSIDPAQYSKGGNIKSVDNDTVAIKGNLADYSIKATANGVIVQSLTDKAFKVVVSLDKATKANGFDSGNVKLVFADGALDLARGTAKGEYSKVYFADGTELSKKVVAASTLAAQLDSTTTYDSVQTPTTPSEGQSYTLTTGADTPTLTAGNDSITGTVSSLSTANTLNAGDKIDGLAGTDTLKADLQSDFAGFSSTGGLSNVENVELTNAGSIARNFNATGVSGVQQYTLNGQISLNNLADTSAAVAINNVANGAVTVAYAAKATDGTSDTQAISLNNVGTAEVKDSAGTVTTAKAAVTVTANGIETLALTTAGTNVVTLTDDKATTITVTGSGSLDTNVTGTTTSFDASANTGAVIVDTAAAAAASLKTVATGAGDDTIKADVGDLLVNATINGGAGADRLELSGDGATTQYLMSGVETVSVGSITNSDLTFSAAKSSGITTIEAAATFADASRAATFASLGSVDEAFNLLTAKGSVSAGTIAADNSGASTINVTASADTVKAAVAGSSDTNAVNLTLGNTSSVNLTVGQYANYTGTLTADKAASVTANVAGALNGTISAAAATSAVITDTSTAASTLTLTAGKLTDLNVTAAGDFDLTKSTLSQVERLTVNEAAGKTFTVGALAAVNAVNLSGAGSASLGALGSTTQGYGVTVNAEGLKGLTVGAINTAAAQNIAVNAATVLGGVTLSGATVADASGAHTGSIGVDVNGTTGAVKTGILQAATVTVDAAGALKTLNTVIHADTATVTGAGLGVNTVDVTVTKAATVTGGIADDVFTLQAGSNTTVATVSFDGGLGSDKVTLFDSSFIANSSFSNVEKLDLGANTLQIDNATLANLVSSKTVVDGTTGTLTIKGGDAADTINASKLTLGTISGVTIDGGKGDDTITGTSKADIFTGGAGADKFVIGNTDSGITLATADTITDFVAGTDKLSLGVDATATNSTFNATAVSDFAAAKTAADAAFASGGTEYYVAHDAANTYVFVDNGAVAGGANQVIVLNGVQTLTTADIVA